MSGLGNFLGLGPIASAPLAGAQAEVAYDLSSAVGAFTLSGQAAHVYATRRIAAAAATFTLTGKSATLWGTAAVSSGTLLGFGALASMPPASGHFPARQIILVADAGAFVLTGKAVRLAATRKLYPLVGTFTLTGRAALFSVKMPALAGAFTLSGKSAHVFATRKQYPLAGAFNLTGKSAILRFGHGFRVDKGTFTLSGQSVHVWASRQLHPAVGTFVETGKAVRIVATRKEYPLVGQFVMSGQDTQFEVHLDLGNGLYVRLGALQDSEVELEGVYLPDQVAGRQGV